MDLSGVLNAISDFIVKNLAVFFQILLVVFLSLLAIRLTKRSRQNIEKKIIEERVDPAQQARLKTLVRASASAVQLLIIAIAAMIIMMTMGINLAPLVASVGVASLAISLGAQSLIKDFIGGLLILIENQFNVGDEIQVGQLIGTVEKITLRTTYMRDSMGKLFIIPNGDIRTVSNNSLGWSKAVVDLNVGFDVDMSRVMDTLQAAIARINTDEALSLILLEKPQVTGWNNLTDWSVQVRLSAKTVPGQQATAAAGLRRHALQAFNEANIPLAQPA